MSTSSAAAAPRPANVIDPKFAKWLVIINGLVPAAVLAWDAFRGQLGVNEVNYAIRTTGMLSLVFLVLSLAITPLRRLTGWNQLIAVRRNLGLYGFFYALAHFSIFFLFDRDASVISTAEEIWTRRYLWFGFGALLLMVPLAVTSTDSMVTRIGPRRWKLLHRLAYAAVIGGVVHYYLLVKADVTKPAVFAIVLGGLLAYRVVFHYVDLRRDLAAARAKARTAAATPPRKRKFWSGELRIARIFDETPDVKTFRMISPDGGPLPFEHVAGQYLNLALEIDGKRVNRSYTIASSPTRAQYCEISVKRCGHASGHLHATLREGQTLKVSAPAGKFVFAGPEAKRVVLIAGGVGITPMMSIVRSLTDRCWTGEMYLLFSVRTRADVVFESELAYLSRRFPNLRVLVTLTGDAGADWDGARGQISREMIEGFVPGLRGGPVFLCGPDPMMTAMRKVLVEIGVPDAEIHQEAFLSPPAAPEPQAGEAGTAGGSAEAAAAATAIEAGGDGDVPNVRFLRAGKTADLPVGLTVLEAAEEAGVDIPFECRSGICGQCKTRLVSGRVAMEVQDALTPADKSKGLILACQARAASGLVVDA